MKRYYLVSSFFLIGIPFLLNGMETFSTPNRTQNSKIDFPTPFAISYEKVGNYSPLTVIFRYKETDNDAQILFNLKKAITDKIYLREIEPLFLAFFEYDFEELKSISQQGLIKIIENQIDLSIKEESKTDKKQAQKLRDLYQSKKNALSVALIISLSPKRSIPQLNVDAKVIQSANQSSNSFVSIIEYLENLYMKTTADQLKKVLEQQQSLLPLTPEKSKTSSVPLNLPETASHPIKEASLSQLIESGDLIKLLDVLANSPILLNELSKERIETVVRLTGFKELIKEFLIVKREEIKLLKSVAVLLVTITDYSNHLHVNAVTVAYIIHLMSLLRGRNYNIQFYKYNDENQLQGPLINIKSNSVTSSSDISSLSIFIVEIDSSYQLSKALEPIKDKFSLTSFPTTAVQGNVISEEGMGYLKKLWYKVLGYKEIKDKTEKSWLVKSIDYNWRLILGISGVVSFAAYLKLRGMEGAKQDARALGSKMWSIVKGSSSRR